MNKRLLDALLSVSSRSTKVKALADRAVSEQGTTLIKELQSQITALELEIQDITTVVEASELLSEEDCGELTRKFSKRLAALAPEELLRYTAPILRMYPKSIRRVLAGCLLNTARANKVGPLAIWMDVIALDGEML